MASRKSKHIHASKYIMAVRKCITFFSSLLSKDTSLLTCSYIEELRNGRKFKYKNKPFIVLILISRRVLFYIYIYIFIQFELTAVGMHSTKPEIKTACGMVDEL